MSNSHYIIRNYRSSDFNEYLRLRIEAEKINPTVGYLSPKLLQEQMGRPNYSPQENLFLAERQGAIVGYMDVTPELDIKRVILDCFIHPEHRQRRLAKKLLAYANRRAREFKAEVAQVYVAEANLTSREVLSKLGFQAVRRFIQLKLKLADVPAPKVPSSLLLRHLKAGEENKLAEIQNRSFAGSWGYNQNTVEEIVYLSRMSNCSPRGIFLACQGDKLVGYCWTRIDCPEPGTDMSQGQIFMLGVDPSYRGRQIGKALLLTALNYLKSKGLNLAELTVDSKNKAACSLYQSVGFKTLKSYLWYEKAIT